MGRFKRNSQRRKEKALRTTEGSLISPHELLPDQANGTIYYSTDLLYDPIVSQGVGRYKYKYHIGIVVAVLIALAIMFTMCGDDF